jgi:flagellar motor switch protein FliN/FliY
MVWDMSEPDEVRPQQEQAQAVPEEDAQTTEQDAVVEESDSAAQDEASGGAASVDPLEALREPLNRWFAAAGRDCSSALSRKALITVCSVTAADADSLAELFGKPLTVARASIEWRSNRWTLALAATQEAILSLAAGMLGEEQAQSATPETSSAFEEFARQIWGSLEGALVSEGAEGLHVEPVAPEELEAPPEELREAEAGIAQLSAQIESHPEAEMSFMFPLALGELISTEDGEKGASADTPALPESVERILQVAVPLIVQIARRRTNVREVLGFRPGAVVEFDKKSDELLDLFAGKCKIGKGEAVKVGESFGIRVLDIGTARETAAKLGGAGD